MTDSFRKAASIMDPEMPPCSLNELAGMHRGLTPAGASSLRSVLARHNEPAGTARFLAYNTMLLDGFSISNVTLDMIYELIDDLATDILELVLKLVTSPTQFVEMTKVSVEALLAYVWGPNWAQALADFLGVVDEIAGYIDSCLDVTTFGLWGAVKSWADVTVGQILNYAGKGLDEALAIAHVGIKEILEYLAAIGVDPLPFLFDTFGRAVAQAILVIAGSDVDLDHIGTKPEVPQRAAEIGLVLRDSMELGPGVGIALPYQIVSLVEVFADSSKQAVRDGLAGTSSQFIAGPDASASKASSGIFQVVRDLTVLRTDSLSYQNRGDPWRDADYWANKGVAVSLIQLGPGVIELYSTHLYNGGDLIKDPSQEEKLNNKRAQVGELISFFNSNHDQRNVAMIVGDFNLAADDAAARKKEREVMVWLMEQTKTRDLWEWQWSCRAHDRSVRRRLRVGHTGDGGGDPTAFCRTDAANMFCSDDPQFTQAGERIDWVLVEDPRPEHTFTLDLSRLRRRPFPRAGAGFLSDHVGLDTTLIANTLAHA